MKNKNGFTLVELLISIIVASIIILTAGVLSSIALKSFNKEYTKEQTHNDLSYGLKLIRNRFRNAEASSVHKNIPASSSWVGLPLLEIGKEAFGIYKPKAETLERQFVFLPDKANQNDRKVILTVPDGDLTWSVTCDPSCPDPETVTVVFKGIKKNSPFYMETTIARRNP